jgi:hypothetical protein
VEGEQRKLIGKRRELSLAALGVLVILSLPLCARGSLTERKPPPYRLPAWACQGRAEDPHASIPEAKLWWQNQVNVMNWATLHQAEDRPYLSFARQLDSTIADHGIFFGHYQQDNHPGASDGAPSAAAQFYHQHGLKVIAFLSVEHWDPAPDSVAKLISVLKSYVDMGCDGIHLDMLFQPATVENAAASVARMREEIHRYGQEKYGRAILLAGNVWRLDSPFALQAGGSADVAWIESWGNSDLEVVRMARVARSLGEYRKPVWYHFQPDTDTQDRVLRLVNLPRALISSCLFENAQFLYNYKYPVPITRKPPRPDDPIEWKMFYITEGWKRSVLEYARFTSAYKPYLTAGAPQSKVLVAFQPGEVSRANAMMDTLLQHGISFNVRVYGSDPFRPLRAVDLQGYTVVLTPTHTAELDDLTRGAAVYTRADDFLNAVPPEVERFLKIEGDTHVLGRVTVQGKSRIVHLKQTGYTDAADGLRPTGPLRISLYAPGVKHGFAASPESPQKTSLKLQVEGDYVTFTLPGLQYYTLAVLE